MKKQIEVFIGNVNQLKLSDFILLKSHLYEVVKIQSSSFTIDCVLMDNEGNELEKQFGKEVFINY